MNTDINAIKTAVKEAMDEKMQDFWVDREVHYQHHLWLKELIDSTTKCKGIVIKVITSTVIIGAVSLLVLGASFWVKMTK